MNFSQIYSLFATRNLSQSKATSFTEFDVYFVLTVEKTLNQEKLLSRYGIYGNARSARKRKYSI